jgi:hypothetical protein
VNSRSLYLLATGIAAFFLLLGVTTLRGISPTSETALWMSSNQRTVTKVIEGADGRPEVTLGGPLADNPSGTINASLIDGWTEEGIGPLRLVYSTHRYWTSLRIGELNIPWMVNEYSAGFPDWIPMGLYHLTGRVEAGEFGNLILSALIIGLAVLWASRKRGSLAGLLVGLYLATDIWFHIYKKMLGSTEIWLQGALLLLTILLFDDGGLSRIRKWASVGLVLGIGLSVKVTFLAVAFPLFLIALFQRRSEISKPVGTASPKTLAASLGLLAFILGSAPTWTSHLIAEAGEVRVEQRGHDNVTARFQELSQRWKAPTKGRAFQKRARWTELLLTPGSHWRGYYFLRGKVSNDQKPIDGSKLLAESSRSSSGTVYLSDFDPRPSSTTVLHSWALALFFALTLLGTLTGAKLERALCSGAAGTLFLSWLLHGDSHHMALGVPLIGLALGVGASRGLKALQKKSKLYARILTALLLIGLGTRLVELGQLDRSVTEDGGRLVARENLETLASMLLEEGALNPAVLTYELVGLPEGLTQGRVKPWLWWNTNLGAGSRDVPSNGSNEWLELLLRSHAAGHLLIAAGPPRGPGTPGGANWFTEASIRQSSSKVGLKAQEVRTLRDRQGRWYATLWALTPSAQ